MTTVARTYPRTIAPTALERWGARAVLLVLLCLAPLAFLVGVGLVLFVRGTRVRGPMGTLTTGIVGVVVMGVLAWLVAARR